MSGVHQTSALSLDGLAKRMAGFGSSGFRRRMSANLAEEARTQVANGFRGQRDPYGNAWARLKHRVGQILRDTGRLAGSVATTSNTDGFRIDMPVVYAGPHQYGARIRAHTRKAVAVARGGKARAGRTKRSKVGVSFRAAHEHPGAALPQRQMIPMASTGGLGPIWSAAFDKVALELIDAQARKGDT